MSFMLMTPLYFEEYGKKPEDGGEAKAKYLSVYSPAALEVFFPLEQEIIVRKLMESDKPIEYALREASEKVEPELVANSEALLAKYPHLKYYWDMRTLVMNMLGNRRYIFEKRMLLINYAIKTIQGMIDLETAYQNGDEIKPAPDGREYPSQEQIPTMIADFINGFTSKAEHDEVMKYFENIRPNFAYSMCDALAFLTSLPSNPDFDKVKYYIFKNLGLDQTSRKYKFNPDVYLPLKRHYYEKFLKGREYYIENVMSSYVWAYSVPFSDYAFSAWENFCAYNVIFNAIKVMLTCYITADGARCDDDFVFAITAFDKALSAAREKGVIRDIILANRKSGMLNNGDMAILAMS